MEQNRMEDWNPESGIQKIGKNYYRSSASHRAGATRTISASKMKLRFPNKKGRRFSNEARQLRNFSFALKDRLKSESSFIDNRREIASACDSRSASINRHFQQLLK
jgi:hypothetical protein